MAGQTFNRKYLHHCARTGTLLRWWGQISEFESKTYFLTVYNYSKFIEVERLLALERKAIKNVPNSADMAYLKKYKVMGVHGSLLRILQDSALTMALPIRLRTPPLRWPMVRPKEHCRQKVSLEKSR